MKATDKKALEGWDNFKKALFQATTVDTNENAVDKAKRMARLEANAEEWFKYYFPNYYTSEPAPFHKAGTRRVLANPEWYEVRAWSRELAKDARTMMELMYLALTGKKRFVLFISNSYDNAVRLLTPYKINFESNQRIINDYGKQEKFGSWEDGEFTTTSGVCFRALGAGQSPRGARNEEIRPDVIVFTDIDTDEDCNNPETIEKKWNWIEQAALPTRSISKPLLVLFLNNIIAEYCCTTEAMKKADKVDIVNIRTNGVSSWPQKNTEAMIDRVLSKISFKAAEQEYFNRPYKEGKVFKELVFGKVPDIRAFGFLVAYGDPAPSNHETKKNSSKTVILMGMHGGNLYVIKCFLEQTQNSRFADWFYETHNFVNERTQVFNYIENNTLQDPFYQQVFKPLFYEKSKSSGIMISILPDERKKPDKFTRIEGNLEPINRFGNLIFNEKEKDNPHMKRLIDQFKAVSPTYKGAIDGPDAVEGGYYIVKSKIQAMAPVTVAPISRSHSKRY